MPISRVGTSNKWLMTIFPYKLKRGYTLIELSLIILLIGVILVFVLPKLDNIGDTRLRTTARQLAGKIQSLYDESVLKKKPYQLVFDITNRTYSFSQVNEEETSILSDSGQDTSFSDKVYIKDIVMEAEGKIAEGKVALRFYPDGYVEKNTIHLSDGKKDYTLETSPLSGKVKISEGYVEVNE
ncbi:MAG: hypothetical protein IT392_01845 [Nitrospirae bacterium]|nr:hypothetical protein [Nitrospirota bacterium]